MVQGWSRVGFEPDHHRLALDGSGRLMDVDRMIRTTPS